MWGVEFSAVNFDSPSENTRSKVCPLQWVHNQMYWFRTIESIESWKTIISLHERSFMLMLKSPIIIQLWYKGNWSVRNSMMLSLNLVGVFFTLLEKGGWYRPQRVIGVFVFSLINSSSKTSDIWDVIILPFTPGLRSIIIPPSLLPVLLTLNQV